MSLPRISGAATPRVAADEESPGAGRRVLVVAPEPFYEDRGTPIAVKSVLHALSELQYDVDLLTYPVGQPIELPRLRIFRSPNPFGFRRVPVGFSGRKVLLDAMLVPVLWLRLLRGRYCCIHAVEEAAFPAVVLGRLFGLPVIYDMQSSLPGQMVKVRAFRGRRVQAVLHRCEQWLLKRANAVVSSAGLLHRVGEAAPGTPAHEWQFPPPGDVASSDAQAALRAELQIPPGAPVVVYAGTFEPYQGLLTLLAAIRRVLVAIPDAAFVLVGGEGEPAEEVRREAARLGLNGSVRILGRKPRGDMATYLAMADLLVSPRAYGDNVPLKVFDYLAAGRPIVATDLPAHRALLDETRAVLIPPTPGDLAKGIIDLLGDPARAAQLASSARAYATSNLGWGRFLDAVKAVYEQAVRPISAPVAG